MTNEQRARLIGWHKYDDSTFWCPPDGGKCIDETELPRFDTDANAVAELRKFVRSRGKDVEFEDALYDLLARTSREIITAAFIFDMLDATPAQQCAAFDIVFNDELEKL